MDITYSVVVFLISSLLQINLECRELDGYPFPVYVTESCPRNEAEWNKRSAVFNCTKEQTYACFPNNEITELIEFCYPLPIIAIPKGLCLYLSKKRSQMEAYECNGFEYGCPDKPYRGSWIFNYSACVSIGEGCFLAEPLCRSAKNNTENYMDLNDRQTDWTLIAAIVIPIIVVASIIAIVIILYIRKTRTPVENQTRLHVLPHAHEEDNESMYQFEELSLFSLLGNQLISFCLYDYIDT
ncbi:uncharacterized protein LOC111102068 isoform X2 [Crassostrea virginica]